MDLNYYLLNVMYQYLYVRNFRDFFFLSIM